MDSRNKTIRDNTGLRLMVLFGSFCILLCVAGALFVVFSHISGLGERGALLLSSASQCLLAFCVPVGLCAMFASGKPGEWLGLDKVAPFRAFAGVVVLYVLALPAMNELISWNASLHFPAWAAGLEKSLREMEDAAAQTTSEILSASSVWSLAFTICVVGLLTGFSEELFFRGAFQKIILQSGMGRAFAVWTAAFVFSAIHFQFFGFVPRLLMGAIFGYLYLWSGSLWLPIFAHALNNSIVVAGAYFGADTASGGGIDTLGVSADGDFPVAAAASAAAVAIFLWRFRKFFFLSTRRTEKI